MSFRRSGAETAEIESVSEIWIMAAEQTLKDWYSDALQNMAKIRFISSFSELDAALMTQRPELLVADLNAKDESLTSYLVKKGDMLKGSVKVIVSALSADSEVIRHCFDFGCEDVLIRPTNANEFKVKVERLLYPKKSLTKVHVDPVRNRLVGENDATIELTSKEFVIFYAIYHAPLRTITKDQLVKHVWSDVVVGAKTLDVHIFNIRKKVASLNLEIKYFPPNTYSVDERGL